MTEVIQEYLTHGCSTILDLWPYAISSTRIETASATVTDRDKLHAAGAFDRGNDLLIHGYNEPLPESMR